MAKQSLKQQSYELIKSNIINCVYPPGTIITEDILCQELEVSRTPIREALNRLETERLVTVLPKRGIEVTNISLNELNMIYETRLLIEPYAILKHGCKISQQQYLHFYKIFESYQNQPVEETAYYEVDEQFHQLFIDATENSYLINTYQTVNSQISRTRILSGRASQDRLFYSTREHLDIVKHVLSNNWEAAAKAMEQHLQASKNSYFEYMMKQQNFLSTQ